MDTVDTIMDGNVHQTVLVDSDEKSPSESQVQFSFGLYDALIDLCESNIQYYECDNTFEAAKRFLDAFHNIIKQLAVLRQYVTEFYGFLHEYDFDENTPANGFRSIVKATHGMINHTMKLTKHIAENRGSLLFRKMEHVRQIETCSQALTSLCSVFEQANVIRRKCDHGSLLPIGKTCLAIDLFNLTGAIDQYPFYSRVAGFHYCRSMQMVMSYLEMFIVWYSELYYNENLNAITKATTLVYNCNKYHRKPNFRAKRFLELSSYAGIDFAKAFLSLTEMDSIHAPSNLFNAKIKVNRMLTIPPESLEIENVNNTDKMVKIPVPSSHLGIGSVTARLLSNVRRQGMQFKRNKRRVHPMSNSLIIHCHGGGFVAHTSKSHEIYLRDWAAQLQVPILSIDYSLSPQAPYPRALEEIFYAYCWAIKNAELLGTTAERIVLVGDSAGAVLNMALILKCIEQSVRRPDGALLIYCPMIVGFEPSPSRLLTVMDTLIPFGFLMKVLKAYVHPGKDQFFEPPNRKKKSKDSGSATNSTASIAGNRMVLSTDRNPSDDFWFDLPKDQFISPLFANDEMLKQLPPMKFVTADMDPFVDDSVTMAKRLKALGKDVGLDVLNGLPHGFLNFVQLSKEAHEGSRLCISRLSELLSKTLDSKKIK